MLTAENVLRWLATDSSEHLHDGEPYGALLVRDGDGWVIDPAAGARPVPVEATDVLAVIFDDPHELAEVPTDG
jgi:hypothetical protein